jgi:hypothetical protein
MEDFKVADLMELQPTDAIASNSLLNDNLPLIIKGEQSLTNSKVYKN